MNESKKASVFKELLRGINKEMGRGPALYRTIKELEYSSRDEIWMFLEVLKDLDLSADLSVTELLVVSIVQADGNCAKQNYSSLYTFVENLRKPPASEDDPDESSFYPTASPAYEAARHYENRQRMTAALLAYIARENAELFTRLFRKQLGRLEQAHSAPSLGYIRGLLLSTLLLLRGSAAPADLSVFRKSFISLVQSAPNAETLEISGAYILSLGKDAANEFFEEARKKDDHLCTLRLAASLLFARYHYLGRHQTDPRVDLLDLKKFLRLLIARDLLHAMRKCSKVKSSHQLLYVLAVGTCSALGVAPSPVDFFETEALSMQAIPTARPFLLRAMRCLSKILYSDGNKSYCALARLALDYVQKYRPSGPLAARLLGFLIGKEDPPEDALDHPGTRAELPNGEACQTCAGEKCALQSRTFSLSDADLCAVFSFLAAAPMEESVASLLEFLAAHFSEKLSRRVSALALSRIFGHRCDCVSDVICSKKEFSLLVRLPRPAYLSLAERASLMDAITSVAPQLSPSRVSRVLRSPILRESALHPQLATALCSMSLKSPLVLPLLVDFLRLKKEPPTRLPPEFYSCARLLLGEGTREAYELLLLAGGEDIAAQQAQQSIWRLEHEPSPPAMSLRHLCYYTEHFRVAQPPGPTASAFLRVAAESLEREASLCAHLFKLIANMLGPGVPLDMQAERELRRVEKSVLSGDFIRKVYSMKDTSTSSLLRLIEKVTEADASPPPASADEVIEACAYVLSTTGIQSEAEQAVKTIARVRRSKEKAEKKGAGDTSDGAVRIERMEVAAALDVIERSAFSQSIFPLIGSFMRGLRLVTDLGESKLQGFSELLVGVVARAVERNETAASGAEISSILRSMIDLFPWKYKEISAVLESVPLELSVDKILLFGSILKETEKLEEVNQGLCAMESEFLEENSEQVLSEFTNLLILLCKMYPRERERSLALIFAKIKAAYPHSVAHLVGELEIFVREVRIQNADWAISQLRQVNSEAAADVASSILRGALSGEPGSISQQSIEWVTRRESASRKKRRPHKKGEGAPEEGALAQLPHGAIVEKTWALQRFFPARDGGAGAPVDYSRYKAHCEFIYTGHNRSSFAKQFMVFFIKHSPHLFAREFLSVCEQDFEVLSSLFPCALLQGLRSLPLALQRSFVEALIFLVQRRSLSPRNLVIMKDALEFLCLRGLPCFSALDWISRYRGRAPMQCALLSRRPSSGPNDLSLLEHALLFGSFEEACCLARHLARKWAGSQDVPESLAMQGLHHELDGRYSEALGSYGGADPPAALRCRVVEKIRDLGRAGEDERPSILAGIEELCLRIHRGLSGWNALDARGLFYDGTLSLYREATGRALAVEGKALPRRLEVRQIQVGVVLAEAPESAEGFARLWEAEEGLRLSRSPRDRERSLIKIRNEAVSESVGYKTDRGARPLESLLSVSVRNRDSRLFKGVASLMDADGRREVLSRHIKEALQAGGPFGEQIRGHFGLEQDLGALGKDQREIDSTAHLARRMDGLAEGDLGKRIVLIGHRVQREPTCYDLMLFLALLDEFSDSEDLAGGRQIVWAAAEETARRVGAGKWVGVMHEVFLLLGKCRDWSAPLAGICVAVISRAFVQNPERTMIHWAYARKACSYPGGGRPEALDRIEGHALWGKYVRYAELAEEISEVQAESIQRALRRFREAGKHKRQGHEIAETWSAEMGAALESNFRVRDIQRLQGRIREILERTRVFLEPSREEEGEKEELRDLLRMLGSEKQPKEWEVLVFNKIAAIHGGLESRASLRLTQRGKEALTGVLVPGEDEVRTASVDGAIEVYQSLQRPRKLRLVGEDGRRRAYIVKHEKGVEIEKMVSLYFGMFGVSCVRNAEIISPSTTISAFVSNSLSIKEIVGEARRERAGGAGASKHKEAAHREKREIEAWCRDYNSLRELEKIELYLRLRASRGEGNEITEWFANGSRSFHEFAAKRRSFSKTYLSASLHGYIMGLGDRHPANILVSWADGEATHIDYIDCLDILSRRRVHQERVPMRLTPMITESIGRDAEERLVDAAREVFKEGRMKKEEAKAVLRLFFLAGETYRHVKKDAAISALEKKLGEGARAEEAARKLFAQATDAENLAQMYLGWMPFW